MDKFNKELGEISKMTLDELKSEEMERKKNVNQWAIILGIFIGIGIYGFINKGNWIFVILPFIFIVLNSKRWTNLKRVRKEILLRDKKI